MLKPIIKKWTIHIFAGYGSPEMERNYARKISDFLDEAEVGDVLTFVPEQGKDSKYTFSVVGLVYGRDDFKDGEEIATSDVRSIERIEDEKDFGPTYAVLTRNTTYYIHGDESKNLLRAKASCDM